ncbi:uncharacterized protein LOC131951846 [Physella acuta]|uniref:uncharacterized protein LOC131951846 n=1 Tax=Physella acuta TaxID=109671 RepID=UPI0027DB0867|nr:uncharacterized protein LOC131951846 [Physella acuta]
MAFHQEWAWYNLYFPNPDAALCRIRAGEQEFQRQSRWRDFEWFNRGGLEASRALTYNRGRVQPYHYADSRTPHLLPPAGSPSGCHALRHPSFYYEMFYRMLEERNALVSMGLLPPDLPNPLDPNDCRPPIQTTGQYKELKARQAECAVKQMERRGWFNEPYARRG